MFHDITHFLKQHLFLLLFPIVLVTNLITLITCQHLPNLISGHCQKFFSQNFNSTLLGNYIWLLNFLFNPSCTTQQTNIVTVIQSFFLHLCCIQIDSRRSSDQFKETKERIIVEYERKFLVRRRNLFFFFFFCAV